jgi:branched-subunit amino acid aminotransferase/4-amino-4-deoxychorismate lyase
LGDLLQSFFLFYRTTNRTVYEKARASRPECDDVVLWNPRGEITETTTANIVLNIDGQWLTSPIGAGLLAGVMRACLLAKGIIREAVLTREDLSQAKNVAVINSARKWVEARFLW